MTFWDGSRWIEEPAPQRLQRQSLISRLLALTTSAVLLIAFATLFPPAGHTLAVGPTLAASPASAQDGMNVTVSGSYFPSKSKVQLEWDGSTAGMPSATVNAKGAFGVRMTVPRSASAGSHTLAAMAVNGPQSPNVSMSLEASVTFTVTTNVTSSPTPGATATPTPTDTPAATATPTPTDTPAATATPTPTDTPAATATPTPTDTPAATATPRPTVAPTPTPTAAPTFAVSASGFVRRTGTTLSLDGAPYRFDGLNMYSAVQAPCWPWSSQWSLDQSLIDIGSGQEVARVFAFQHTTVVNGVRDWSYIDAALATFAKHGVRVVMVLTDQWSGQPCTDSTTARTLAWYQTGYKTTIEDGVATYRDWVSQVVSRYANNATVAMWQFVNEGEARNSDGSCSESMAAQALKAFGDDVGGLAKSIDPNHLTSLGTISGECGSNQGDYQYIYTSNVDVADYHDYGYPYSPMGNTDSYNGLQVSIDRAHADDKPIMVAEMGIHYTSLTTPTTAYRATLFDAKWGAQFTAGSVGELLWTWNLYASPTRDYEIGPTDQSLALTTKY